jgi:hypothetical protein
MGVPEEEEAVPPIPAKPGQLGDCLLRRSRVLLGIIERPVGDHNPARRPSSQWERRYERTRVIREDSSRPAKTLPRERRAALVRQEVERDQIVIPGYADGVERGYDFDALVRVGPVAARSPAIR